MLLDLTLFSVTLFREHKIDSRILGSVLAVLFMLILMSCRTALIQPIENELVRINKLRWGRVIIKNGIGIG